MPPVAFFSLAVTADAGELYTGEECEEFKASHPVLDYFPTRKGLGVDCSREIMALSDAQVKALVATQNRRIPCDCPTWGGTEALHSMLMQSDEGVLRLFPVWPRERDARFVRLRARGAFLVSAELADGCVRNLRIASEKGQPPVIENPWSSDRQSDVLTGLHQRPAWYPQPPTGGQEGSDHRPQLRKTYEKLVSGPKTGVVRCAVHCFKLNGKVERFFRTFKAWARLKLFAWFEDRKRIARWMQRKLDVFRDWHNTARPNQAVGGPTPEEAWSGASLPEAMAVQAHDPQPKFQVKRRKYGGDPRGGDNVVDPPARPKPLRRGEGPTSPHLPVLDIAVEWPEAA